MLADDLTLAPPRVSVVVAAYNASSFIGAAIASVQAQTEPSWELLVVDDCSTDETPEIVADLASRDARIRTIRTA
ncbi:MAG: glycosyltransferase family 2 protein, partial [Janthinobacterium lividum]